jgi:large subunit ribosomal protein L1
MFIKINVGTASYDTGYYHRKGSLNIMAKKDDLLEQAKKLKLKVTAKNTIAEIEAAITAAKTPVVEAPAVEEIAEEAPVHEVKITKAGKRSEKAIREADEIAEKEARKAVHDTTPQSEDAEASTTKGPKPITRPKIERRGKAYRKVAELVDNTIVYTLTDALELATKTSPSKFDATVELHIRLGVDPRQADQNIRATVSLPNGTGKTVRVAVFAPETEHAAAQKAGADVVGDDDFLKQLEKGEINFDILIATPQYMPKLGKYARLLGPKGLMPNPKSGSVAADVAKAVTEAKAGKVEYRVDKQSIVHLGIGKVSFGAKKLEENANAFFESLRSQKPTSLKGVYVKSTSISTTQGPGIKVENSVK